MKAVLIFSILALLIAISAGQTCNVLKTPQANDTISGNSQFFFLYDYFEGYNMNFSTNFISLNNTPYNISNTLQVNYTQQQESFFNTPQSFVTIGKYVKHQFFRGQFMNFTNTLYIEDIGNTQFDLRLGSTVAYLTQDGSDFLIQQFNRSTNKPIKSVGTLVNLTKALPLNNKTKYQCFDIQYIWNANAVTLVVDCQTVDNTNPQSPVVMNLLVGVQWYDLLSSPAFVILSQKPFFQTQDVAMRNISLSFFQSLNGQGFLLQSFYFSGANGTQNYIQPYLIVDYIIDSNNPLNWLSKQWPLSSDNLVGLNSSSIITNVVNAGGKLFFYDQNQTTVYGLSTNFTNVYFNHTPVGISLPTKTTAQTMKARFDGITLTVSVAVSTQNLDNNYLGLIQFDFSNSLPSQSNQIALNLTQNANIVNPLSQIVQLDFNDAYWMFIVQTNNNEKYFVVQALTKLKNIISTYPLTDTSANSYQGFDMCVFCQASLVQQLTYNQTTNNSTAMWNFNVTKNPYLFINLQSNENANISIEINCTSDTNPTPTPTKLNFNLYQPNYVQLTLVNSTNQTYNLITQFPELTTISLYDYLTGPDLMYQFTAFNTTVNTSSSMQALKQKLKASNTTNTTTVPWSPQFNVYDVILNQIAQDYFINLPGYTNQITITQKSINQPQQNLFLYVMQNHNRNIFVYSCSNPDVNQFPSCDYNVLNNYDYNNELMYFELMLDPTQNTYQQQVMFLFPADNNISCIINFLWPFSMQTQQINFCAQYGAKIQSLKVINNQIFVVTSDFVTQIKMQNFTTFYYTSQTITQQVLNTTRSLADIFVSDINNEIVYVTTDKEISLYNTVQNKFYITVPVPDNSQDYQALQVGYFLYFIQQQNITQYQMFPNQLDNTPQLIQNFQLYNKNPSFQVGNSYKDSNYPQYIDYTSNFLYVYDFQNFIIYIYRVGYNVFNTLYKSIQLQQTQALDYLFAVEGENGVDQLFLVIEEDQQTNLHMLNIYDQPSLALNSYWNFTNTNSTSQTYNFDVNITSQQQTDFYAVFNFSYVNNLGNVNYTIPAFTYNSSDNSSKLTNSIFKKLLNVKDNVPNQVFTFNPQQISSGFITHFTLNCSFQNDCNNTDPTQNVIQIRNPLGFNRTISKVKMFNSVAKNSQHTFAQARNKLIRLGFENNTILDLVQFPFSDTAWTCPIMQNSDDDTYSFSACTNGKQWTLYGVSYLSSQPHVFLIQPIQTAAVSKFYIQNDFLFILDSANNQYNYLHVYQMSWPTAFNQTTVTTGLNFVSTFNFQNNALLHNNGKNIVDNDMNMVSMLGGVSNVFFIAFADGNVQYISISQTGIFEVAPAQYMSQYASIPTGVTPVLAGVRVYNSSYVQPGISNFIMLLVFKNTHTYEIYLTIDFQQNAMSNQKQLMQYNQYGFFHNTNNIQVLPTNNGADGFIVFPAVQPSEVLLNFQNSKQQNPFPLQYLLAYNRTIVPKQTFANVYGAHPFNTTLANQSFVALSFQAINQTTNYTILTTNPETGTLDRLYLSPNVSIVFQNSSFKSQQVQLIASNLYSTQTFTFNTNAVGEGGSSKIWIVFVVVGLVLVALLIIGAIKMYNRKKKTEVDGGEQTQKLLKD